MTPTPLSAAEEAMHCAGCRGTDYLDRPCRGRSCEGRERQARADERRRWADVGGRIVALLLTSGRQPPPLNDYGLLSTLHFYAGPNARTLTDPEEAKRVTALGEAVRDLRTLLADDPEPGA